MLVVTARVKLILSGAGYLEASTLADQFEKPPPL
jgi:hypothetical protein